MTCQITNNCFFFYSEMNCLWLIKPAFQDNNTRLVFQFQSQSLEKGVITACTDYVTIEGLGGIFFLQSCFWYMTSK